MANFQSVSIPISQIFRPVSVIFLYATLDDVFSQSYKYCSLHVLQQAIPTPCPADVFLNNINNIHCKQPHHDTVHSLTVMAADKDISL